MIKTIHINSEKNCYKIKEITKPMIIFYYMEGCPACIKFKPIWNKFKQQVKHKNLLFVEVNSNYVHCLNIKNIQFFPTIKFVNKNKIATFNMERTIAKLNKFVNNNIRQKTKRQKRSKKKTKKRYN